MVDIETHKVIDMIASRESAEVAKMLKKYPDLKIVSRDGSVTYKSAIEQTGMKIEQVSDRFHLLKGLTDASKKYICRILEANFILPTETSQDEEAAAEGGYWDKPVKPNALARAHLENVAKKERLVNKVRELKGLGLSNRAIAKRLNINRASVAKYLNPNYNPVNTRYNTTRPSKLKPYAQTIKDMLSEGKKLRQISSHIRQMGYDGSDSSIRSFAARERKLRKEAISANHKKGIKMERKWLVSLLYRPLEDIKSLCQETLDFFLNSYPMIGKIFDTVRNFKEVLFSKKPDLLDEWPETASRLDIDELNSFIKGVRRDITAVKNAIHFDYNNGLAEGSVNKLKLIKRVMYGRASFNLLRNKLLLLDSKARNN